MWRVGVVQLLRAALPDRFGAARSWLPRHGSAWIVTVDQVLERGSGQKSMMLRPGTKLNRRFACVAAVMGVLWDGGRDKRYEHI